MTKEKKHAMSEFQEPTFKQQLIQWWDEMRDRDRYVWHMTRKVYAIMLPTLILPPLSYRLNLLTDWIPPLCGLIFIFCNGYIYFIGIFAKERPSDWEDFK